MEAKLAKHRRLAQLIYFGGKHNVILLYNTIMEPVILYINILLTAEQADNTQQTNKKKTYYKLNSVSKSHK